MNSRTATVRRDTTETQISVTLNLDGSGKSKLSIGLPFLEHMLDQVARHGMIDLDITAHGDLKIDAHHTVEDVGITFGQALTQALGEKKGIRRYGHPASSTTFSFPARASVNSMSICSTNSSRAS